MDSNGIEDILNEKDELDDILAYVDKKKNEPFCLDNVNEFFPTQPIPAFFAHACSRIGAESVKARPLTSPISS